MTVLVTGCAGYIGSHTAVALLEAGFSVVGLDNFSNSARDIPDKISKITAKPLPFYEADIRDAKALDSLFGTHKIDCVIHFAAKKAVGESVAQPLLYYANNVAGTVSLCAAMNRAGCKRMVFSSSATVYGNSTQVPFREDLPLSCTNPYGATKMMIEQILADLCISDPEWSAVSLRYFNPLGAHESGLIGENPEGIPNNLMPYITQVAAGKRAQLSVFGADYPTPDGTGVRDYIHVTDLAHGHLAALDYCSAHTGHLAINLGTGHGYSVLEVIRAFEQATGVKVPYALGARRAGDIAVSYADPAKAKQLLGWEAKHTLAEMCRDSWRFTQTLG